MILKGLLTIDSKKLIRCLDSTYVAILSQLLRIVWLFIGRNSLFLATKNYDVGYEARQVIELAISRIIPMQQILF